MSHPNQLLCTRPITCNRRVSLKPRMERPMSHVCDSYFAGRSWGDLAHMQAGALTWCTDVPGRRPVPRLDRTSTQPHRLGAKPRLTMNVLPMAVLGRIVGNYHS
jgi:hypothetical protein